MKKPARRPLVSALLNRPLVMVFEIQNGSGYIALVRSRDAERAVYQGAADELRWVGGVRLEFAQDGNTMIIDVRRDGDVNPRFDLQVGLSDYSRVYSWPLDGSNVRIKLLNPRRYTLNPDGDQFVIVRK